MIFVSTLLIIVAGGVTLVLWQAQRDLVRQQRQRDAATHQLQRVTDRLTESQKIGRIGSWERDLASNRLWWSEESYRLFDITPDLMPEPDYDFFVKRIHPTTGSACASSSRAPLPAANLCDRLSRLPAQRGRAHIPEYRPGGSGMTRARRSAPPVPFQDVTGLRRQEHELRERGEQLRTIIENIPGGVSLMDGNLDFVAFNAEFGRLLDFPHELVGRTPLPMMELACSMPGAVTTARATRRCSRSRWLHAPVRRSPIISNVRGLMARSSRCTGAPLPGGGFVTIYTDVTERRRNEEKPGAGEEGLRQQPGSDHDHRRGRTGSFR